MRPGHELRHFQPDADPLGSVLANEIRFPVVDTKGLDRDGPSFRAPPGPHSQRRSGAIPRVPVVPGLRVAALAAVPHSLPDQRDVPHHSVGLRAQFGVRDVSVQLRSRPVHGGECRWKEMGIGGSLTRVLVSGCKCDGFAERLGLERAVF